MEITTSSVATTAGPSEHLAAQQDDASGSPVARVAHVTAERYAAAPFVDG